MSATRAARHLGAGQNELLSERGQATVLAVAMAVFSMSLALALAFADARVHRHPAAVQFWHEPPIDDLARTTLARRPAGRHATIVSPRSPTTRA